MSVEAHEAAKERVNRYAPYPTQEPSHAGLTGMMVVSIALFIFLAIAGLETKGRIVLAVVAMAVLGFIVPYLYFDAKRRRYHREVVRVYSELEDRKREA